MHKIFNMLWSGCVILVYLSCCSCGFQQKVKYRKVFESANLRVEWRHTNEFRVNGTAFSSLDSNDFRQYVYSNIPDRKLAHVVVGKFVAMDEHESEQMAVVARLKQLGFKRVVCQVALSSDIVDVCYDSDCKVNTSSQNQ